MITHPTTSPPIRSLSISEQTGTGIFCDLWPYVTEGNDVAVYKAKNETLENWTVRLCLRWIDFRLGQKVKRENIVKGKLGIGYAPDN